MANRLKVFKKLLYLTRYERKICFLLSLQGIMWAFQIMLPIVANYTPEYHCGTEKVYHNDTVSSSETATTMSSFDQRADEEVENLNVSEVEVADQCKQFANSSGQIISPDEISACKEIIFELEEGEKSAVTELELVCDNSWALMLSYSASALGGTVGSVVGGALSDKFGRKWVIIWSKVIQAVTLGLVGLSYSPISYVITMGLAGTCGTVNYSAASVLCYEMMRRDFRNISYMFIVAMYCIGGVIFAGMAYFIRDWRWMCLTCFLIGVPYISYIWLIDESPLWLAAVGRRAEAEQILKKIAEYNHEVYDAEEFKEIGEKEENYLNKGEDKTNSHTENVWANILKEPVMVLYTIISILSWMVSSIVYSFLILSTNELEGNRFTNACIGMLFELLANIISWLSLEKMDRRITFMVSCTTTAVGLAVIPYLKEVSPLTSNLLSYLIRVANSMMEYIVYLITPEIFPTAVRQSMLNLCASSSAFICLLIPLLLYGDPKVTSTITSSIMLLVATLNIFLPNTMNKPLPETLQDSLELKRNLIFCTKREEKSEDGNSKTLENHKESNKHVDI